MMHLLATATPESTAAVDWLAPVLMVVGVIMLGLILTFSIRGKIDRRNADRPTPRERIEQLKSAAHRHDDIHGAKAEALDVAQDLAARVTSRAERLEQLIAEADERIARLEAAFPTPASRAPESQPPPALSETNSASSTAAGVKTDDPLTSEVYQLADAGRSPLEIARELDEQIGKVELILALRRG